MARKVAQPSTAAHDSVNEICSLRLELVGSKPLIWRELEIPTSITLKVLHDIIQAAMDWFDQHLWEIRIKGQRYGPPSKEDWGTAPLQDATKTRLRTLISAGRTEIEYLYDFGDNWELRLVVDNVRQGDPSQEYPRYVGGQQAAPPEDCGGIPGFYRMLEILADPDDPEHGEVMEWLDGYDPEAIDELRLTIGLSRIANRRNAARSRLAKKG